jgi:hypothetical protein
MCLLCGAVPIKVLANFKRVKALSKDLDVVVAALAASPLLQVQADTKRVRRLAPLPEVDTTDIERRTVLVEHLPTTPTIGEQQEHAWRTASNWNTGTLEQRVWQRMSPMALTVSEPAQEAGCGAASSPAGWQQQSVVQRGMRFGAVLCYASLLSLHPPCSAAAKALCIPVVTAQHSPKTMLTACSGCPCWCCARRLCRVCDAAVHQAW